MAVKWPLAAGLWSNAANWNDGTKPVAGDIVHADGRIVTIDEDINVESLRTTQRSGGTVGGWFTCATPQTMTFTDPANWLWSGVSSSDPLVGSSLRLTHNSGLTTINAPAMNHVVAGTYYQLLHSGNGDLTLNVATITAANNAATYTIRLTGTGSTVIVNGDFTLVANNSTMINCLGSGTLTVNGNLTRTAGTNQGVIGVSAGYSVTVNGVVDGSAVGVTGAQVITALAGAVVTINGALYGGASTSGLLNGAATWRLTGPFYGTLNGGHPFPYGGLLQLIPTPNTEARFASSAGGTISLWGSDVTGGTPAEADVRQGVLFGLSDEWEGTCAVPPAGSVAVGVPVDDTVGTAALTPGEVWDHPTASATTAGSMGERLKNAATVESTGDQVAGAFP